MPLRYTCRRTPRMPSMNGRLDDPVWKLADWTEPFVDIEGEAPLTPQPPLPAVHRGEGGSHPPSPRFSTRAKMLWDDDHFYIAAEMEEPHLWATLTEHDSVIFHDNDFEVFIDPDGDAARYFEFEINALNTTWDLYLPKAYRDGGSADNSWETYAITATHLRGTLNDPSDLDQGWSVEIAFPWECFRASAGMPCPPRPGDVWRVNFSRVEWDLEVGGVLVNGAIPVEAIGAYCKVPDTPEHNWVWSPQGVIDMHQPEQWGFVEFVP